MTDTVILPIGAISLSASMSMIGFGLFGSLTVFLWIIIHLVRDRGFSYSSKIKINTDTLMMRSSRRKGIHEDSLLNQDLSNVDMSTNTNISSEITTLASHDSNDTADDDVHANINHDLVCVGPTVPQEISFFVTVITTNPSEDTDASSSTCEDKLGKHHSTKRKLVVNLQNMTWSLRKQKPKKMLNLGEGGSDEGGASEIYTPGISGKLAENESSGPDLKSSETDHNHLISSSDDVWEEANMDNIYPIKSLLNVSVSTMVSDNYASVEITFVDDANACSRLEDNGTTGDDSLHVLDGSMSDSSCSSDSHYDDEDDDSFQNYFGTSNDAQTQISRSEVARIKNELIFDTKADAGAFQTLYLATKSFGRELLGLYLDLELVHKYSKAGDGVALDDVYRCLGDLPVVSKRLVGICQKRTIPIQIPIDRSTNGVLPTSIDLDDKDEDKGHNNTVDDSDAILSIVRPANQYRSKRMLLGYLDFFCLFVPTVFKGAPYPCTNQRSDTTTPHLDLHETDLNRIDEHQAKTRVLARTRFAIAKAAARIRAYAKGMEIVKRGWEIPTLSMNQQHHICSKRRLAFDDEVANQEHDELSENEHYDPLISRDHLQAFNFVGYKALQISSQCANEDIENFNFSDPVDFIPSLKTIVEKSPKDDFFITSILNRKQRVITFFLFVKWLPRGLDEYFDRAFDTVMNGSVRERNEILTFSPSYASKMNSILSPIFGKKMVHHTSRKFFKGVKVSNCAEHFGGSLRTNFSLPSNYSGILIDVERMPGQLRRIFGGIVPEKGVSSHILDLNFQLRDNAKTLAAIRIVHTNAGSIFPFEEISSKSICKNQKGEFEGIESATKNDYKSSLDSLADILSCITVPSKSTLQPNQLYDVQVLQSFHNLDDIKRHFVAAKKDLKEAAIRITKCAAFRGLTFPIDTHLCHVELCSRQFFQQGWDLKGNPVFYFRNFCEGIWRKHVDASILAVLHRLETSFIQLAKMDSNFICTLVVLLGKPRTTKIEGKVDTSSTNSQNQDVDGIIHKPLQASTANEVSNTSKDELHVHTNFKFVQRLIETISQNYPERLNRALVVSSGGWERGWEKLLATHGLRRYINCSTIRKKVSILDDEKDLFAFISPNELIHIAGGYAQMNSFDETS